MVEPNVEYFYVAEKLATAIQQAMWSEDYTMQSHELLLVRDALRRQGGQLWAVARAREDRATILRLLEPAAELSEDARAKGVGTLSLHLERMSDDDQMELAAAMLSLLRFCERKYGKSGDWDG